MDHPDDDLVANLDRFVTFAGEYQHENPSFVKCESPFQSLRVVEVNPRGCIVLTTEDDSKQR